MFFFCFQIAQYVKAAVSGSSLSAVAIPTIPNLKIPNYQPQNCGEPIHESVEEGLREAYRAATAWINKSKRYCCTVGLDSRVKVWEATEPVKVEEVEEDIALLCSKSLNVSWPEGALQRQIYIEP